MANLKTSTAHNHFIHVFGDEGALVKMKECGFDGVDFSFDHWQLDYDYFLLQDEDTLKKFCARQKAVCDRIGLDVAHTHAPYYFCDPKHYDNPDFVDRFINAIKATKYLGSNLIVIHPTYYPDPENNFERSVEINTKFYKRLQPYAIDLGVKVAVENLCAVHPITRKGVPSSNCSAEKLIRIIDGVGEGFCACLDTGHAFFCGQDPATQLRLLGDRVKVLHLHDNDGTDDWHLIPGCGKVNWEEVLKALKEINFSGYINTEVNFLRTGREETIMEHAKLVNKVSRDFIDRIEKM
jgi:sugar phosphate isomerase/epimerase